MVSKKDINEKIAKDILRYGSCLQKGKLGSWGLSRKNVAFLRNNPNAVLFSAIFDYSIDYKKAWAAPFKLQKRLGHIDLFRIAKMTERQLLPYFQRGKYGPALHRFPSKQVRRIILASRKLIAKYKGNALNIWQNGTRASLVIKRLEEFEGIGQKISRMLCRILIKDFYFSLIGLNKIDIAVDRHVARVFLRTGLIERQKGIYSVGHIKEDIIQCARTLSPSFPGCLDEPAFDIGREWCTTEKAYCNWHNDPCPVRNTCRKKTDINTK